MATGHALQTTPATTSPSINNLKVEKQTTKPVISVVQAGVVSLSLAEKATVYTCRRCRYKLFADNNLSSHQRQQHGLSRRKLLKDRQHLNQGKSAQQTNIVQGQCSSYFMEEAMDWMKLDSASQVEGKLLCPSCSTRLGSFSWMGAQCSCGTWITPALQIPKSRVDIRYIAMDAYELWQGTLKKSEDVSVNPESEENAGANEENEVTNDSKETEDLGDVVSTDERDSPTCEADATESGDVRINRHTAWLQHSNEGNRDGLTNVVDIADCSLTTVRNKVIDGYSAVCKGLEAGLKKMEGRLSVVREPVRLASGATRTVFSLAPVAAGSEPVYIGEAIWWSDDDKVQHINRQLLKPGEDASLDTLMNRYLGSR